MLNKFGIEESHITEHDELLTYGMDSIAIIELRFELLKKLGLEDEDLELYEEDSIRTLANKIKPFIKEKEYA